MRRSFLLFLALLPFLAHAQQGHMGPRFGAAFATRSIGGLFQNTSNLMAGPLLGWHFEAPLHPQVSLMPEILYLTKGFANRNPAQAVRIRETYRYLEVPLLLKVGLDKTENGIYLLAGPSVGYFLSGRSQFWQENEILFDNRFKSPLNGRKLQLSGMVGMGMEGPRWGFDVRAMTSLTPFDRFQRIQNVVYALTFAYRIPGKG